MPVIKHINIIRLSGKLHVCPDLHDTKELAEKALSEALGNYSTPHLKFVTMPISIELDEKEVKG